MVESLIFTYVNYNTNVGYKASFCLILTNDYRHFLSVSVIQITATNIWVRRWLDLEIVDSSNDKVQNQQCLKMPAIFLFNNADRLIEGTHYLL